MNEIKKILIVIQARNASTRLPGKVMLPLSGEPLLVRLYERINSSRVPKEITVATTTDAEDDSIADLCVKYRINVFRGHPTDLLDRHYKAGLKFNAGAVVKIPSDCPLISPDVIDKVLKYYDEHNDKYDFVSNLHPATYPDGNDVEVIPMKILGEAFAGADKNFEREHTTPYIWERKDRYRIGNVEWETGLNFSMSHRFTIDYMEDYEFIKRVYEELYDEKRIFGLTDILNLLERKPEIKSINEMHAGVNWYRNHLDELKTVSVKDTRKSL